jgi:hypothetical protein
MVMQPELIKTDENLVDEVRKVIEELRPQCASPSCHLQQMIDCLRGKFV